MTETNGDTSAKPEKIAGKIINPDAGERIKERRLRLQGVESSVIKESPQVAVDKALRGLVKDQDLMKKLNEGEKKKAVVLGSGGENRGWSGGHEDIAQLTADGLIRVGAFDSVRGWMDGTKVYELTGVTEVRQEVIDRVKGMLDFYSNPDVRREYLIDDLAWRVEKKRYEDQSKMDRFKNVPSGLVDREGKAFICREDGTILSEHRLYEDIFGKLTPDQMKKNIEESINNFNKIKITSLR